MKTSAAELEQEASVILRISVLFAGLPGLAITAGTLVMFSLQVNWWPHLTSTGSGKRASCERSDCVADLLYLACRGCPVQKTHETGTFANRHCSICLGIPSTVKFGGPRKTLPCPCSPKLSLNPPEHVWRPMANRPYTFPGLVPSAKLLFWGLRKGLQMFSPLPSPAGTRNVPQVARKGQKGPEESSWPPSCLLFDLSCYCCCCRCCCFRCLRLKDGKGSEQVSGHL